MPKQTGVLRVKGTADDTTFYRTQDGDLMKTKSSISRERLATDPAFERTRENYAEFGAASTAAKCLRIAVFPLIQDAADNRLISRLIKQMMQIKDQDTRSTRGERRVGKALTEPAGRELLKGFNFNKNAKLKGILLCPVRVHAASGKITITGLVPGKNLIVPKKATHIRVTGAFARVDFQKETGNMKMSKPEMLAIDGKSHTISLTPAAVPTGSGVDIYLLKVEFIWVENGLEYPVRMGRLDAVEIVEVK